MASTKAEAAELPGYTPYNLNAEKPGGHGVLYSEKNTTQQLPAKIPFYRRKDRIIIIILLIAIVIGVVVGGAVGGTKASTLAAQRDSASAGTTTVESVITTTTPLPASTTTLPASTTTLPATSTTVTSTISAPSPTPSNCVWEGTAPFCDGKCHTGFTQIMEDNCGDSPNCCLTGFKVWCCQE